MAHPHGPWPWAYIVPHPRGWAQHHAVRRQLQVRESRAAASLPSTSEHPRRRLRGGQCQAAEHEQQPQPEHPGRRRQTRSAATTCRRARKARGHSGGSWLAVHMSMSPAPCGPCAMRPCGMTPWAMGHGPWSWSMVHGPRSMAHGPMVHGMVHGPWSMVHMGPYIYMVIYI